MIVTPAQINRPGQDMPLGYDPNSDEEQDGDGDRYGEECFPASCRTSHLCKARRVPKAGIER